MTADPHQPLRDDVRLLGTLLGDTLRAIEGEPLFAAVEEVRALAKHAREGDGAAFAALERTLQAVPVERAVPVARAFAHFLTLANIAEQHHRIRRRREYLRDTAAPPQRASFADTFERLRAAGVDPQRLCAAVGSPRKNVRSLSAARPPTRQPSDRMRLSPRLIGLPVGMPCGNEERMPE